MPRHWFDQRPLLERQHERLDTQLAALIAQHQTPGTGGAAEQQLACRSLLRALRLHLRLEERWLQAQGLLCPGHRASHQAAVEAANRQWQRHGGERAGRLALLESLQGWFLRHLQGPDAVAYGLAAAVNAVPQPPISSAPPSLPAAVARSGGPAIQPQGTALA